MKQYLIPASGQFYKANLHCHTTVSDGSMTPEEVKEYYKAHGYSVIAFTDHCVLIPHPELRDEDFLPLNGFETEIISPGEDKTPRKKHCHLCFVSLDENNVTMPFFHRKNVWGNGVNYLDQIRYDPEHSEVRNVYDPARINEEIRLGVEAGFFVTYNHPSWSTEFYEDYIRYRGMSAMEIMNFGAWHGGFMDYNPRVYDDLLRAGNRLFAIATDDNHGKADACGGWTMIKADALDYPSIAAGLKNGHFYASWGPEIHELWFEDGTVHITTSPAARIACFFGNHRAKVKSGKGELITEASFEIEPNDPYFRITVIDGNNRCADTNAYFTDTLLP